MEGLKGLADYTLAGRRAHRHFFYLDAERSLEAQNAETVQLI